MLLQAWIGLRNSLAASQTLVNESILCATWVRLCRDTPHVSSSEVLNLGLKYGRSSLRLTMISVVCKLTAKSDALVMRNLASSPCKPAVLVTIVDRQKATSVLQRKRNICRDFLYLYIKNCASEYSLLIDRTSCLPCLEPIVPGFNSR